MIFHGSLQFARLIQRKSTNWYPGVYCNLPQFECVYYFPRFGELLLNSNYIMLPFGELKRRKDWLFDTIGENGNFFLRPSSGFKTFTGQVVNHSNIDSIGVRCDPEEIVIASKPIEIVREWRTIVNGLETKIITGSQYKVNNEIVKSPEVPMEVLSYASDVIKTVNFHPDPIWVLDVCETKDGKLMVLEVGSFSCSGLYNCDPQAIVETVNRIIEIEES